MQKIFFNRTTKNFLADDAGAVTVDWVVLTAALVGLGLLVVATVSEGTNDFAGDLGAYLTDLF